ncbi:hypothetical protein S7711_06041 [Stachybotrys chartarum IBT 7711]|uniref:cyclin-dependent kinase n=1 Tax=Stachybotrys chartarum (strain CBS 109288 / IBT 7711) TaxID=1280523 RepID=A0A084B202_STACB|nr:hypothetical protein S7711_06041 [Stachybotrys chartarum IBT 7711]KFA54689.1 hypothetical protein S40293_00782 [Stachybotrys chartarum IBT 40293]
MRTAGGHDDRGERARNSRGAELLDEPGYSPREPRHRPHDRPLHRSNTKPDLESHSRSRNRRDPRDRSFPESTRRPVGTEDLIPRYRSSKVRQPESDDRARRSRSRGRGDAASPSSIKRQRTRSRSPGGPDRKKSRRDRSPSRRGREHSRDRGSKRKRHSSQERRNHSPRRLSRSHHHSLDTESERHRADPESPTRSLRDSEYRSRRGVQDSRQPRVGDTRRPSISRSPASESRRSLSRRPHSLSRANPQDSSSSIAGGNRSGPEQDRHHLEHRRRDTQSPRGHHDRRRPDETGGSHFPSKAELREDMTTRDGYRGAYGEVRLTHKSHYNHDTRGHSPSPQHGGSYHASPSRSPYGGGRGFRDAQQYSPLHQSSTSHQYNRAGYGPPGHQLNSSHSPPHPPSGPNQNSTGSHRGGSRGTGAGFQRGSFTSRGGHRGSNFKNAHWNSGKTSYSHGHQSVQEADPGRESHDDLTVEPLELHPEDADGTANTRQTTTELGQDDIAMHDKEPNEGAVSSSHPPTGPSAQSNSSSKFSFAFKTTSKAAHATPKPEISQKLNAVPVRKDAPPKETIDREPPRSAPREPASARSRHDSRLPPDGPKLAPRMRKVKKIMTRPKPRPTLPSDLIDSESVFFRKPGNESVVGSGTYGKVFKGLNVYTKGLVALKRIRMEGERDGFPVTAVREIKLLQSLRHLNIVNLQEVMVEKNDCFMVFEYLSHDLTGLLHHPNFKLEDAQKKHLAKQLFEGLDYLHERGVLHRDIKAANILVSNEGILKLADFGLARFYAKRHQLDYTNRVITIWYRSPELLLGETKYTAAVDVWSAACVMVEIFTKHAIFPGDGTELNQLEKIYNILGTPTLQEWPGLVDMAWFELLRPTAKKRNVFAEKYQDRISPAAFELLTNMFCYDPAKRPTAAAALQHTYFTTEEPLPKQAIELSAVDGDWHEFESKALRKENERRDREARKAAKDVPREKDKKRLLGNNDNPRDAKRPHMAEQHAASQQAGDTEDGPTL